MVKKHKLSEGLSHNYTIIGIVSRMINFQLCFHINNTLHISLKREGDLPVIIYKSNVTEHFPFFRYTDPHYNNNWMLVSNRNQMQKMLLVDLKLIDYFLFIENLPSFVEIKNIIVSLKNIAGITLAQQFNMEVSKGLEYLFQDIEIYLSNPDRTK